MLAVNKEIRFMKAQKEQKGKVIRMEESPVSRALFGEVHWAWLWLILRVFIGWEWLQAGLGKIGNAAWTGDNAGAALTGFVSGALAKTEGAHPDVQLWYAWFLERMVLPNAGVWSYLVVWGEILVGFALIVGLFTGIAAFFGSFMNINYLLAGTVSTNPIMLLMAVFIILAWRTAGWWGLDRWVLPALGTPWRPGYIFKEKSAGSQPVEQSSARRAW
jgi:thiosulfate dehydrogenase (quinone) large subunit